MSKWMEDKDVIFGIRVGLESTSEAPVGGEKGGFTAKKDNQTRLCPLQGRRINIRVARGELLGVQQLPRI